MTAATDEAWIQGSLARLETLEAQREQLAASGQTAALAEIDEEIRALYEVLESVAGDEPEQAPANTGMAAAPMQAAPNPGMAAAPMQAAPNPAMGMGMAPMQAPDPMQMGGMALAPMQAPGPGPNPAMGMGMHMGPGGDPMSMDGMAPASTSYDLDDDIKPPRGPLPFILIGLLVVGGGAGAFFMLDKGNAQEAKPEPTAPARIIQAGEIAEDTQEPKVAKGGDADRTQGTNFKEGSNDGARRSNGGGGGGGNRPRPSGSKKGDDGRKIKVVDSNDPLAGID